MVQVRHGVCHAVSYLLGIRKRECQCGKEGCLWKSVIHNLCKPATFPDSSTYFRDFDRFAC